MCRLVVASLLFALVVAAHAATLNVPTQYSKIQSAIDAASDGDVVVVAPRAYLEHINFEGKAITVRGTDPANPTVVANTIICGSANGTEVTFNSGETAASVLSGFTLTSGLCGVHCYFSSPTLTNLTISDNTGQCFGGGLFLESSSPALTNVTISGNSATDGVEGLGGGLCCFDGAPDLTNVTISGNSALGQGSSNPNSAGSGGGVECENSSLTMHLVNIYGNSSMEGGGIHCSNSSLTLSDTVIMDNHATAGGTRYTPSGGGGVACDSSCSAVFTDVYIEDNVASIGGGVWCDSSSLTLTNATVSGNLASVGGGGGLRCSSCSPTLTNATISGNSATNGYGGGLYCELSCPTLKNTTLSGNGATSGGGVYCAKYSQPALENTIVAGSTSGGGLYCDNVFGTNYPLITYCDFYGNSGGNFVNFTDPTGTQGNVSVDPLFVSAASGNFRLKARSGHWGGTAWVVDSVTSPCLDAGDPASAFNLEPAPNGGRVNMGFDGNTPYASKSGVPPTVVSATYVDATHVNVLFSLALASASAQAAMNYKLSPTRGVTAAVLDGKTVHLTTATQTEGTTYTVTVSGVKSAAGTPIVTGSGDKASWVAGVPPTVQSVTCVDDTHVDVLFSKAVGPATSQTAAKYKVSPTLKVPSALRDVTDLKTVHLVTATQTHAKTYTLTVSGVKTETHVPIVKGSGDTASWTTNFAPTVQSVTYVDATHVDVLFSRAMGPVTSQTATNYKVSPTKAVTAAVRQADLKTVRLTTAAQTSGVTYTLTVSGVKSASAVLIVKGSGDTKSWKAGASGAPGLASVAVTVAAAPTSVGAQIMVNLTAAAEVTVTIRNLAGREIAVLTPGQLEAGVQSLLWNGRSTTGTKVPAGTYLLQVTAHGASGTSAQAISPLQLR